MKLDSDRLVQTGGKSHLARGAWIEIIYAQGVKAAAPSHLARGAWIEIRCFALSGTKTKVAPRKRCVD